MKPRQHAYLARALQDACGGVDACLNILEASPYKMGRTHMYDCREPSTGRTMPIGAVQLLELVHGKRLYTAVICQTAAEPTDAECATSEACELNETAAEVQRLVRLAAADHDFTENEKREIEPKLQVMERHIAGLRGAMDAKGPRISDLPPAGGPSTIERIAR